MLLSQFNVIQNPKLEQQVSNALNHIKIKNSLTFNNISTDIDIYLESLAEYVSPKAWICRSAHNITRNTASIEKKQIIEEFSDVIRKKDGISCLAQLLIDRLEDIVGNNGSTIQLSEREILKFAQERSKFIVQSVSDEAR